MLIAYLCLCGFAGSWVGQMAAWKVEMRYDENNMMTRLSLTDQQNTS